MAKTRLDKLIGVRLSSKDAKLVRKVADLHHLESSSFIRKVVLDYLDDYMEKKASNVHSRI